MNDAQKCGQNQVDKNLGVETNLWSDEADEENVGSVLKARDQIDDDVNEVSPQICPILE